MLSPGTQERLKAVKAVPQIAALAETMKMPESGEDEKGGK